MEKLLICWLIFSSVLECPKRRISTSRHSAHWASCENAGSRFPSRGSIDRCSRTWWSVSSDYIVSCIVFWLTGLKALYTSFRNTKMHFIVSICSLLSSEFHYLCTVKNSYTEKCYFGSRNCPSIWNTHDYWISLWAKDKIRARILEVTGEENDNSFERGFIYVYPIRLLPKLKEWAIP